VAVNSRTSLAGDLATGLAAWFSSSQDALALVAFDAYGARQAYTGEALDRFANRTAGFLRSTLGVERGDHILLAAAASDESVAVLLGAWKLGAAVRLLPLDLAPEALDAALGTDPVRALFADAARLEPVTRAVGDRIPPPQRVSLSVDPVPGAAHFAEMVSYRPDQPPVGDAPLPNDPALVSAAAQGWVSWSQRQLVAAAVAWSSRFHAPLRVVAAAPLLGPRAVTTGLLAPWSVGGVAVLPPTRPDADLLGLRAAEGAAWMTLDGTQAAALTARGGPTVGWVAAWADERAPTASELAAFEGVCGVPVVLPVAPPSAR
jgi:acyl-CoA synthetase (AMP-forming)/AMP-acid ligase II